MGGRTCALGASLLLWAAGGCGTLYNHEISPCPKSRSDTFRVYGGVRKDLEEVATAFVPGGSADPDHMTGRPALVATGMLYLAVDLPLSAVGDTVLLPITVPAALRKDQALSDAPSQEAPNAPCR